MDIHLVVGLVGRKKQEVRIPVSKAVLAIVPDTDDVPVIGSHEPIAQTRRLLGTGAGVHAWTRFAHWLDSPQVVDLLYGQLKKEVGRPGR